MCHHPIPQLTLPRAHSALPVRFFRQVSIDGTSFTADRTTFQYYPTPEVTRVTPDTCRPPSPRLRLDGEQFRPNEALMVRFEEEQEERCEGTDPGDEGKGSLVVAGTGEDNAPLVFRSPPRVFTVPGRVESEIIETGTDPDTELPIHEERWFVTCDSPPLPPGAKLPFISRLTIAPNGADFTGEPLRFVAHDPHADICLPAAVPVPLPVPVVPVPVLATPGDDGDEQSGGAEPEGPCIRITGRNLYRGADLSVRLRFGLEDESVVLLQTVSFDAASESVVGVVPVGVGVLVAGAAGAAPKGPDLPPATTVVVEVSVDGQDFFAVPDRLTVYRGPNLALHGDGVYPPVGGGWAELKTTESAYRGLEPMVRRRKCCCSYGRGTTCDISTTPSYSLVFVEKRFVHWPPALPICPLTFTYRRFPNVRSSNQGPLGFRGPRFRRGASFAVVSTPTRSRGGCRNNRRSTVRGGRGGRTTTTLSRRSQENIAADASIREGRRRPRTARRVRRCQHGGFRQHRLGGTRGASVAGVILFRRSSTVRAGRFAR